MFFVHGTWMHTSVVPSGRESKPARLVSFIVPTYHAGKRLSRCLQSIRKHHDGQAKYEILVSFDGGPDEAGCRKTCSVHGAKFVGSRENEGFSVAANRAIKKRSQDSGCVVLVNDDLWFETHSGAYLAAVLERRKDVAIVGARLLFPNGTVQHGGIAPGASHIGVGLPADHATVTDSREAWAVTGALMGISTKLLERCKGFDEKFRMAWEDVDLCMTARLFGWKVLYCGKASAIHEEGGTRGRHGAKAGHPRWLDWEERGRALFAKKWRSKKHLHRMAT